MVVHQSKQENSKCLAIYENDWRLSENLKTHQILSAETELVLKETGIRKREKKGFPWWSRKWQPTPPILAREILGTEEPGGLQPMGSQRVRHNLMTDHVCTQ